MLLLLVQALQAPKRQQLANRGIHVDLYEMRPVKSSPAHQTDQFAELVCSNSLRAGNIENAVGL